jgi:sensor histidine kinase YesM
MVHPIVENKKAILLYLLIWLVLTGIHFLILNWFYFYDITLRQAIVDSLVFNTLFIIISLVLWYIARYNSPTRSLLSFSINHIASLLLITIVWITAGQYFSNQIIQNEDYADFLYSSIPWRVISSVFLYSITVLIYYLILYYNDLKERRSKELSLIDMVNESELKVLKSQINPHFLFNSLNSISSLTITNAEKAQEMIIKLSDFLRYTVSKGDNRFTKMEQEMENIQRYLDIEKIRFGDKLQFDFLIDDACYDAFIPVMILQPLYENALKHGVYESSEPIVIHTECRQEEDHIFIRILNNYEKSASLTKGAGIGLRNIRERLRLIYKHTDLMKIIKSENSFEVQLFIPKIVLKYE